MDFYSSDSEPVKNLSDLLYYPTYFNCKKDDLTLKLMTIVFDQSLIIENSMTKNQNLDS